MIQRAKVLVRKAFVVCNARESRRMSNSVPERVCKGQTKNLTILLDSGIVPQ